MKKIIKGVLEANLSKKEKKEISQLIFEQSKAKVDKNDKEFASVAEIFAKFLSKITEKYDLNPCEVGDEVKELLIGTEKALS